MGTFHFHSSPSHTHRERAATAGKEAQRETRVARYKYDCLSRGLTASPGALKMMWGREEVALTSLCAALLYCSPMLAICSRVTFFPAMLTLPEGVSATFFCNISIDSGLEYSLNWYKETNHSQPQKIAGMSWKKRDTNMDKYILTNHTPTFKMEILNLHQNDSGFYYCGMITFFESNKVMESNRSLLVVTAAPEKTNATDDPEVEEINPPDYVNTMLLGILLLAGVAGLLIFGCLTVMYTKGDAQKPPSENAPAVEERPPVVSVSTVDYGVLEFQSTQVSSETWPVVQTEYATIIFPEEKPITPERRKKH